MSTPAGWYPDTERSGEQRYWDGAKWTDHRAPLIDSEAPKPRRRGIGKTLLLGAGVLVAGLAGLSALSAMTQQQEDPSQDPDAVPLSLLLDRAAEDDPAGVVKWMTSPKGQVWRGFIQDMDEFNANMDQASVASDDDQMLALCQQAGLMGIQGDNLLKSPSTVLNETWSEVTFNYIAAGTATIPISGDSDRALDNCVESINSANDEMEKVLALLQHFADNA